MGRPQSREMLYRQATGAMVLGLVINALLGVVKLAAGLIGHSFALIADSVNSLGDVFTSAVMVSALVVGWEAVQRVTSLHATPPVWTLWIAGGNVVIKEALYRYKVAVGRRTGSTALLANAWDHRSDALCSLAVLIGLAIVRVGGESMIWADEAAALVVVSGIVWSTGRLFRASASELMDRQADDGMLQEVEAIALQIEQVRRVETLWIRKSGMEYLADMHIEVDPALTVREGHAIGHIVKDHILERFVSIRNVLVHIEPHESAAAGAVERGHKGRSGTG